MQRRLAAPRAKESALLLGLWLLGTGPGCGLMLGLDPFGPAAEAGAAADRSGADAGRTDAAGGDAARLDAPAADGAIADAARAERQPADTRLADVATGDVQAVDRAAPDAAAPERQPGDAAAADSTAPDAARPDAARPDAAQPDAAQTDVAAPGSCGTVSGFQDDFDDNTLGRAWGSWSEGACAVREQNTQLELHQGDSCYAVAFTAAAASLVGDAVTVELVQHATVAQSETYVQFYIDRDHRILLRQMGGELLASISDGVGNGWGGPHPFNPATMRWLRFREEGGEIVFATSANGQLWSELDRHAAPSFTCCGYITLGAGSWNGSVGETVIFDNFNVDRVGSSWCPASALQDDFADEALDLAWQAPDGSGCGFLEQDGVLQLTGNAGSLCKLTTSSLYLLEGSEVLVELASGPFGENAFAGIELWALKDGDYLYFGSTGDQLAGQDWSAGDYFSEPHEGRRWLRVRERNGEIFFEARDQAGGWQVLSSNLRPDPFGPLYVSLVFDCRTCPGGTWGAYASFDNFNLDR